MGGNVTVQSVYGKGSKFTITINQKILNNEITNEDIKQYIETEKIDLSGKKILLIDDNSLNLKVAVRILNKYNCETETVSSGAECLSKINSGLKYDLLLMDEMMPNMSGTECMQKLKENGYKVPIVALTADVEKESREKYLKAGFDEYLGKPLNLKEFERILNKFLK